MTRLRLPAALAALTLGLALAPATASAAPATLQVDPVQDDVLFADAFHGTMRVSYNCSGLVDGTSPDDPVVLAVTVSEVRGNGEYQASAGGTAPADCTGVSVTTEEIALGLGYGDEIFSGAATLEVDLYSPDLEQHYGSTYSQQVTVVRQDDPTPTPEPTPTPTPEPTPTPTPEPTPTPTPEPTPDPPAPAPLPAAVLTVDASPEPAIKGSTIRVKGSLRRDGKAYKASTVLEFQADGDGAYAKVKTVKASTKGALSASVKADRPGSFRYRFAGDGKTQAGTSGADHVDVRKATVRLTVAAPASVTKGGSVKVKGSIKREGKGWKAKTVLEFRRDGGGWSKVKIVTSSKKGTLSAKVKPSGSGSYRYRYAGSSTTEAAASGADHLVVKPKPPAKPKPKEYANCTALTKVYPHGVGRSGAKDKGGSVTNFVRDTKTYKLNTKSDRDKDGIACER